MLGPEKSILLHGYQSLDSILEHTLCTCGIYAGHPPTKLRDGSVQVPKVSSGEPMCM